MLFERIWHYIKLASAGTFTSTSCTCSIVWEQPARQLMPQLVCTTRADDRRQTWRTVSLLRKVCQRNVCAELSDVVHIGLERPERAQWWRVLWVCRPRNNWNVFCWVQILATSSRCNTTISSQNLSVHTSAINNKMHLFSFSVTYACYYPNLTATTGYHSVHNADIGKLLTLTAPHSPSAICLVQ